MDESLKENILGARDSTVTGIGLILNLAWFRCGFG